MKDKNELLSQNKYELTVFLDDCVVNICYRYKSDTDANPIFLISQSKAESGILQVMQMDYEICQYKYLLEKDDFGIVANSKFKRKNFDGDWCVYDPHKLSEKSKVKSSYWV